MSAIFPKIPQYVVPFLLSKCSVDDFPRSNITIKLRKDPFILLTDINDNLKGVWVRKKMINHLQIV